MNQSNLTLGGVGGVGSRNASLGGPQNLASGEMILGAFNLEPISSE